MRVPTVGISTEIDPLFKIYNGICDIIIGKRSVQFNECECIDGAMCYEPTVAECVGDIKRIVNKSL